MSQTTESTEADLHADRPRVPPRVWLMTARPFSLSATVSPLLVGTAVAAYAGVFHPLPFAAALLSGIFLQVGANYWNEYFDHRYSLDTAGSLGASTVIFKGQMRPEQVRDGGIYSFALAALFGLLLLALAGPGILLFGVAALFIAYFYSARPFTFATRGLGDPLVFLAMGLLMTWGAYFVQVPRWSWTALAASIPVGLLVVAILNMNNVRDYEDDLAVNKRTIVVRLGKPFGRWYHAALLAGAYVATTSFALAGTLPLATLAVWVTFPLAFIIIRTALAATDRRAFVTGIKQTSLLHLLFGLMLAAALIVAFALR
jgi:1,4-dihydroxy-2-naphthoate polyprenyltransferase